MLYINKKNLVLVSLLLLANILVVSCDCKGSTPQNQKPNNKAEVEKLKKELAASEKEELELLNLLRNSWRDKNKGLNLG